MRYILKRAGKDIEIKETNRKYTSEIWEDECKGWYQRIWLDAQKTVACIVDEDGLLKKLETNFYLETTHPTQPVQRVVGDVVIARNKPLSPYGGYDYETAELTDEDIETIRKIFDKDYQASLAPLAKEDNGGFNFIAF